MRGTKFYIDGWYSYSGRKGSQNGELTHFEDGKVIGLIGDDNQSRGGSGTQKLLLGLAENDLIFFAKIAPGVRRGTDLAPFLWTVQKVRNKGGLAGDYEGFYIDARDFSSIPDLELEMFAKGIPTPEVLSGMDVEEIRRNFYFDYVQNLAEPARALNQVGGIFLSRAI
jgi:hypothetical protein